MTILHLTGEGHPAGSSISIALLARAQRAAGHRVIVACAEGSFLASRVRGEGGEVAPVDFAAGAASRIAALAAEAGASVVNAHASPDRAACRRLRAAGALGAALVFTRRAMPLTSVVGLVADRLLVDSVIAVSGAVARALARRGLSRRLIHVVPNAVDLSRLAAPAGGAVATARERCGVRADRPTIGVVARLKDHALLIESLAAIARPVTVVCLGTAATGELEAAARRAAPHSVRFVPFDPEVRPYYDLFDVVALPTRGEGMPQALLEAMALGKPIVASDAGGNRECAREGREALLPPPGDARALARALELLLNDAALARRLGSAARERAAGFSIERTLAGTRAAYAAAERRRAAA